MLVKMDIINTAIIILYFIIGILLGSIVAYFLLKYALKKTHEAVLRRKHRNLVFFEVKLPANNEFEIKVAEQMFAGLMSISPKIKGIKKYFNAKAFVSFEVVAFKDNIKFYVACPKRIAGIVDKQINGTYTSADIKLVKEYNLFPDDSKVAYAALKLDKHHRIPIRTYEDLPVDTLSTLLDAFSKIQFNEAAAFQVVITPAGSEWRNQSKKYIKKLREVPEGEDGKTKKKPELDDDTIQLIDQKASKPGFYVDVRLVAVSEDKESAEMHLSNMMSSIDHYVKEGGNRFKKLEKKKIKNIVDDFIYRIPRETMILNTEELATLYHFPNKNITTPHVNWLLSKKAPAPDFVEAEFKEDYMYIGRNTFRGKEREIFIKPEDRLRHMYIIGQTGTGKSGFMVGMMTRDIKLGHGCGFIDPHGSDAEKILQQVPPDRADDVVFFDPSDMERPFGLNMLEYESEGQKAKALDELLSIFDTLFDLRQTGGPIFYQYFRYGVLLLLSDPDSGATVLEVPKILSDDAYRKYKLSRCPDKEIVAFWEKQAEAAGGEASLKNLVPYITSKLSPFVTNPYVRPIVAQQKSTLDFKDIMDSKKILIAKLSKGKIGDYNAYLLGMILIGKLLVTALSREEKSESERVPFYLYIDEFQNFLTESIQTILSEARKYKLSLTIAHQYISQLVKNNDTRIRDSIFGNVGNKAVFRVGTEDAKFLEHEFEGVFDKNDLIKVENFTFYLKMLSGGQPTPPFSVRSFYGDSKYDMIGKPNPELAQIIKEISRLKYGKPRELVEKEIEMRTEEAHKKGEEIIKKNKSSSGFGGFGGF
ncbi:MAG: hypothetical protein KatS3mg085_322 [Candidatus Dojkabacteria bacterium]|nr:MAG: hypothetical protein KatS3mg085_322 [Candidatus Dojkabacteria bacterium]